MKLRLKAFTRRADDVYAEGECFKNAYRWAMDHGPDDALVVHGKVTMASGKVIDHAWVEFGSTVVDPTTGYNGDKAKWYEAVHAVPEAKYPADHAAINTIRSRSPQHPNGHWGPWEPGERFKPSVATVYEKKRPRFNEILITVDVAKIEADYSQDSNFYVSPGGGGAAIGNRYKRFEQWLLDNPDTPVEPPDMGWTGHVAMFGDGRHRWAVLRDQGAKRIAVTIPRMDLKYFVERYDAQVVGSNQTEI